MEELEASKAVPAFINYFTKPGLLESLSAPTSEFGLELKIEDDGLKEVAQLQQLNLLLLRSTG
ncbi:uncharacterized protein METZ01_LOCUS410015, partial [marine metagenome]